MLIGKFGVISSQNKQIIIVSDSFNRANNTNTLGNADTGQTWEVVGGTWGISSNQSYSSVSADCRAIIDVGISNFVLSLTFPIIDYTKSRLIFRYTDTQNELSLALDASAFILYKRVANVLTAIGTYSAFPSNGDVVKVVCNGDSITVYINDIVRITVTESFNNNATKCGMRSYTSTSARFDNFKVEVV